MCVSRQFKVREICEIRPGDAVITWNDGEPSVSRATCRSTPRFQQTYRLRTLHREVVASGSHSFLALRKTGRCAPPEPRFSVRARQSYAERVPLSAAVTASSQDQPRKRARRRDYRQLDENEIQNLYLTGTPLRELAAQFGVSVSTIWDRLEKAGVPRRRRVNADAQEIRDLYLGGASLSEIAGMLGVSAMTVVHRLDETGTPRRPVGSGPDTSGRPRHSTRNNWELAWVNLEDLHRDDIIITLKSLPDEAPVPDDPYLADRRFLWLLGLALATARCQRLAGTASLCACSLTCGKKCRTGWRTTAETAAVIPPLTA